MTVIHDDNAKPINSLNPLPIRASYDSTDSYRHTVETSDGTGGYTAKTATTGKSIYVTDIIISVNTAMNVQLEDGDGTVLMKPVYLGANGTFEHSFNTPLPVTESKALVLRSSAVGNVSTTTTGYVA